MPSKRKQKKTKEFNMSLGCDVSAYAKPCEPAIKIEDQIREVKRTISDENLLIVSALELLFTIYGIDVEQKLSVYDDTVECAYVVSTYYVFTVYYYDQLGHNSRYKFKEYNCSL